MAMWRTTRWRQSPSQGNLLLKRLITVCHPVQLVVLHRLNTINRFRCVLKRYYYSLTVNDSLQVKSNPAHSDCVLTDH